jgi:hypothetical protein
VFAYGEPLVVPPRLEGRELEGFRAEIERRLNRLSYQVDHWLPLRDRYADPRDVPVPDPVPLPVHPPRRRRRRQRDVAASQQANSLGPES